ncbi:MAG: hypothetical protein IJT79_05640 [Ruminococcus sp.]|nr:hypothetical protein [Ruminococcus sp.]
MMKQHKYTRVASVLLAVLLAVVLIAPTTLSVSAANKRFISELRVEAGEEAVAKLEKDGWSVMMVGLNSTADPDSQVYLAYKTNTGSPITGIVVASGGASCTDKDGVSYNRVSDVDVDKGLGGGAGCIYATYDKKAGSPLVGLDVLRGSNADDKVMYPITNDGAEIVRTPKGTPADLEKASSSDVIYLAQIRDKIVRPYISEIGVVTDSDKWNAVYTACERGFNYYVDGDIDNAKNTYTIIAYDRTADPKDAITNITAVSSKAVKSLENKNVVDKKAKNSNNVSAATVSISDAEYVRVSRKSISAKNPYYIYRTKDTNAGNPISMLYAEKTKKNQNFLLGTWAKGYFFSQGDTTAYTYSMNEDLYSSLWEDKTVLTMLPVQFLDSVNSQKNKNTEKESAKIATPDEAEEDNNTIKLSMLTPRDGLPDTAANLTGMSGDPDAPYVERTERSERVNKYQASVFGNGGIIALVIGVIVIIAAAVYAFIRIKRREKTDTDKPKQSNKSKKSKESKKSR